MANQEGRADSLAATNTALNMENDGYTIMTAFNNIRILKFIFDSHTARTSRKSQHAAKRYRDLFDGNVGRVKHQKRSRNLIEKQIRETNDSPRLLPLSLSVCLSIYLFPTGTLCGTA